MTSPIVSAISLPMEPLRRFCRRWRIASFALFGSVLRADFGPDSDVDVLVEWAPGAHWSILDHLRMENELSEILGHRAEIVSRQALDEAQNWVRRRTILDAARPLDVT